MQEPEPYVFSYQSNLDKNTNGIRSKFISTIDPIDLIVDRCESPRGVWNSTKISPKTFDSNDFSTPPSSSSSSLNILESADRDLSIESISSSTTAKFEFSSNLFEVLAPKYRFQDGNEFENGDFDKKSDKIFNGDVSEIDDDTNFDKNSSISAISRSAVRRRTSLTCRSYKDLLQRGLQVDGTAFVSSIAEKFLYEPEDQNPKKFLLPKKRGRKPRRALLEPCESLASTSNDLRQSVDDIDSQAIEDELKFYSLEQSANEFSNERRIKSEQSKICMLCEHADLDADDKEELLDNYPYCPNLVLCPICGEPYEKWYHEPWKYANFRCRTKQRGLICRAYSRSDCFVCWFWKCVNFVRRENIRFWASLANDECTLLSSEVDLKDSDGSSNDAIQSSSEDQCSSDNCATFSSRFKSPKTLSDRPFDLGSNEEGPRIRYVSRRQSVVTGQPSPGSSKETKSKFLLSAMPRKLKKELVNDRYKAVKFGGRNKLILKLERQYSSSTPTNNYTSSAAISEETGKISTDLKNTTKRKKIRRCGVCVGCKAENCGVCQNCRDMPRFGGLGVLKAACRERQCELIAASHALDKKQKKQRKNNISSVDIKRDDNDQEQREEDEIKNI